MPIPCHLCDSLDKWVIEGDESCQIAPVFVCEHEPIWVGRGSIRQVSSVPVHRVGRVEETSRPLEQANGSRNRVHEKKKSQR